MEHPQLWFTAVLNSIFGGPATALLTAIGHPPADPAHPIADHFAMQVVAVLVIMAILGVVRAGVSVDKPGEAAAVL